MQQQGSLSFSSEKEETKKPLLVLQLPHGSTFYGFHNVFFVFGQNCWTSGSWKFSSARAQNLLILLLYTQSHSTKGCVFFSFFSRDTLLSVTAIDRLSGNISNIEDPNHQNCSNSPEHCSRFYWVFNKTHAIPPSTGQQPIPSNACYHPFLWESTAAKKWSSASWASLIFCLIFLLNKFYTGSGATGFIFQNYFAVEKCMALFTT